MPPNLSGAAVLNWLGFRRALIVNQQYTVTRSTGINSPATCTFAGSTSKKCLFDYSGVRSDLAHFSSNTYYRLLDGSLVVSFPHPHGKPPGWIKYTPINGVLHAYPQ